MRTAAALLLAAAGAAAGAQAPAADTLTLDEAVRTALERQPQLRQARAGSEAASARADQQRSPLLPQVIGSGAYRLETENSPIRVPGHASTDASGAWSFQATLSQLVWDFGQTSGRWRAALGAAEAQRQGEQAIRQQIVLGVRSAFFAARAASDLVGVARESLANQEARLAQTQGFVEVGTRPPIDLAQARTARANAQVQLISAENAYAIARAQLAQAMGLDGPAGWEVAEGTLPAVEGEERSTDELLTEAVSVRPDVAAAASQVRAQQASLGAVRGAYLPAVGVSTGVTDAGPNLGSTYWNWNAQATLTWNLFQGGLTRAQEQEARANLDSLSAQADTLRQQVRLEVEQARLAVRAAKASLVATAEALESAREQLRLAEGRYQTGAGSALELSDAQVTATTAGAQRVRAGYDLATARAQLLKAVGRP
jgi:outer membrane protein